MKRITSPSKRYAKRESGYALLMVLVVSGASLAVMAGLMSWSASNGSFSQRSDQYYQSLGAAEAATEKVVSRIARDFQLGGEPQVRDNLDNYRVLVPSSEESSQWSRFQFRDVAGTEQRTSVSRISNWQWNYVASKYNGLRALASTFRVISNARLANSSYNITAAVQQDVQIASIPLFQFGVFYTPDLEMAASRDMTMNGRIHSNGALYQQPTATLNLTGPVTAAGQLLQQKSPNDPSSRTFGAVQFGAEHDAGLTTLNIPIGTGNDPTNLHGLIELPPWGESPDSPLGKQRFFNRADLIIAVSDSGVVAQSGRYNNFAVNIPWLQTRGVVVTTNSFYNKRANLTIQVFELDVTKLRTEYSNITALLGREAKTIYMVDARSQSSTTQAGVRVINATTLPAYGLTVATPNPLYVKGHFNSPLSTRGTTNTIGTMPGALIGDAITLLSPSWNDGNGGGALSSRVAANTTVNAAFISGIVPSGNGYYSGGVENYFRLLEDWSSKSLNVNGSIVSLYYSQVATAPWGAASDIYNPPNRVFTFDGNFLDITKIPNATPEVRVVVRRNWTIAQANSSGAALSESPPYAPSGYNPFP